MLNSWLKVICEANSTSVDALTLSVRIAMHPKLERVEPDGKSRAITSISYIWTNMSELAILLTKNPTLDHIDYPSPPFELFERVDPRTTYGPLILEAINHSASSKPVEGGGRILNCRLYIKNQSLYSLPSIADVQTREEDERDARTTKLLCLFRMIQRRFSIRQLSEMAAVQFSAKSALSLVLQLLHPNNFIFTHPIRARRREVHLLKIAINNMWKEKKFRVDDLNRLEEVGVIPLSCLLLMKEHNHTYQFLDQPHLIVDTSEISQSNEVKGKRERKPPRTSEQVVADAIASYALSEEEKNAVDDEEEMIDVNALKEMDNMSVDGVGDEAEREGERVDVEAEEMEESVASSLAYDEIVPCAGMRGHKAEVVQRYRRDLCSLPLSTYEYYCLARDLLDASACQPTKASHADTATLLEAPGNEASCVRELEHDDLDDMKSNHMEEKKALHLIRTSKGELSRKECGVILSWFKEQEKKGQRVEAADRLWRIAFNNAHDHFYGKTTRFAIFFLSRLKITPAPLCILDCICSFEFLNSFTTSIINQIKVENIRSLAHSSALSSSSSSPSSPSDLTSTYKTCMTHLKELFGAVLAATDEQQRRTYRRWQHVISLGLWELIPTLLQHHLSTGDKVKDDTLLLFATARHSNLSEFTSLFASLSSSSTTHPLSLTWDNENLLFFLLQRHYWRNDIIDRVRFLLSSLPPNSTSLLEQLGYQRCNLAMLCCRTWATQMGPRSKIEIDQSLAMLDLFLSSLPSSFWLHAYDQNKFHLAHHVARLGSSHSLLSLLSTLSSSLPHHSQVVHVLAPDNERSSVCYEALLATHESLIYELEPNERIYRSRASEELCASFQTMLPQLVRHELCTDEDVDDIICTDCTCADVLIPHLFSTAVTEKVKRERKKKIETAVRAYISQSRTFNLNRQSVTHSSTSVSGIISDIEKSPVGADPPDDDDGGGSDGDVELEDEEDGEMGEKKRKRGKKKRKKDGKHILSKVAQRLRRRLRQRGEDEEMCEARLGKFRTIKEIIEKKREKIGVKTSGFISDLFTHEEEKEEKQSNSSLHLHLNPQLSEESDSDPDYFEEEKKEVENEEEEEEEEKEKIEGESEDEEDIEDDSASDWAEDASNISSSDSDSLSSSDSDSHSHSHSDSDADYSPSDHDHDHNDDDGDDDDDDDNEDDDDNMNESIDDNSDAENNSKRDDDDEDEDKIESEREEEQKPSLPALRTKKITDYFRKS